MYIYFVIYQIVIYANKSCGLPIRVLPERVNRNLIFYHFSRKMKAGCLWNYKLFSTNLSIFSIPFDVHRPRIITYR